MAFNNKSHEEGEKLVVVLDRNTASSNKRGKISNFSKFKVQILDIATLLGAEGPQQDRTGLINYISYWMTLLLLQTTGIYRYVYPLCRYMYSIYTISFLLVHYFRMYVGATIAYFSKKNLYFYYSDQGTVIYIHMRK